MGAADPVKLGAARLNTNEDNAKTQCTVGQQKTEGSIKGARYGRAEDQRRKPPKHGATGPCKIEQNIFLK